MPECTVETPWQYVICMFFFLISPYRMSLITNVFKKTDKLSVLLSYTLMVRDSFLIKLLVIMKQPLQVLRKKGVIKNFAKLTGKHLCQSPLFNKVASNFIEKETLTQVFSCEFYKVFSHIFLTEYLRVTASDYL